MSSVITPTTPTLNTTVLGITTIARGSQSRITSNLDLRTKYSGMLHVRFGRGGTAALSAGVDIYVEPLLNNGARIQPVLLFPYKTAITAAASTTCSASGNTSGQNVLNVASITGISAGDIILIQDNSTPTTASEWHRVSKTAAGVLTLCENLESAHANTGHTVRNQAEVLSWQLPGNQSYALVIDYGSQSTGDTITVESMIETWDSVTAT